MTSRAYKGLTVQQLQSFWEASRLNSVAAAARSLGLTASTVYKQIRALEREFGEPLMQSARRRFRLTDAGVLLAQLAGSTVEGLASVKRQFHELRAGGLRELKIVTTPRIMLDDLPPCVAEFRRRFPQVRLVLRDHWKAEVHSEVESGNADIGFVMNRSLDLSTPWVSSRWLQHVPIYELVVSLVVRRDHPLATKKMIKPGDLKPYRLVNASNSFPGLELMAVLESEGLFENRDQLAEAFFAPSIEKCVSLGLGVGLVESLRGTPVRDPMVCRRVLSESFGRPRVYALRLMGHASSPEADAFEDIVRRRCARK